MKKLYLGRIALSLSAKASYQSFSVLQKFTFDAADYDYKINNVTFGGQGNIGFEYALTPDFNIGLSGGYRYFPESDLWTITLDDVTLYDAVEIDGSPDVELTGLNFGLYLHYSPPALPFDPIGFVRSKIGF